MRHNQRQEEGREGGLRMRPPHKFVDAIRSAIPFAERLTCTIDEACQATGLGRTKLYELIGNERLRTTTIGRRRLVLVSSLLQLLQPESI